MTARVAVVVVRWRGGDEVARCLRSVLEHGGDELADTVLVDSGSADGGAERLAKLFPTVRILALAENHGFAVAANLGVSNSDAPLVLLLNPDAELMQGSLDLLCTPLDDAPERAGTVPQLLSPDGSPQHRWQLRRLPGPWRLGAGLPGAPLTRRPAPPATVDVPQPAAAAWLVRRHVWDALGGLDERFAPAWWEDVDLCARLNQGLLRPGFPARRGFLLQPRATVLHSGGGSAARLGDAAFLGAYHHNLLRYAARHHPTELDTIRRRLSATLAVRGLLRPARRHAYAAARRVVRRLDLARMRREMG